MARCGSGQSLCSAVGSASRHPSYLGLLWGLAFRSGVGVLLTALIIPPLLARIGAEERLLRTQFGGEYDTYCARTSRLIPWLYYNIPVALFRCKLGADKKGKEARPYSASRADPIGSAYDTSVSA